MNESQAREEICRVGRSLFERGYAHATAGNISVRLDDKAGGGFLITPTDACLGFLDPARLARLDASGQQVSGAIASKTLTLHRALYTETARTGQDVRCVIHTHSTHCVAMSLQAAAPPAPENAPQNATAHDKYWPELLPAITPYFVMKVGRVPLIPYHLPGAPEAAQASVAAIAHYARRGQAIRAVMLKRLGPNVWHQTPAGAMAILEELEETAKLWLLSTPKPAPLSGPQIEDLRQRFGAQW
jgi:3-dehydro-4-phosphotetronate decarboxylase